MSTQELIIKEVESLPESLQQEVYDFARFLHLKSNGETATRIRILGKCE